MPNIVQKRRGKFLYRPYKKYHSLTYPNKSCYKLDKSLPKKIVEIRGISAVLPFN